MAKHGEWVSRGAVEALFLEILQLHVDNALSKLLELE